MIIRSGKENTKMKTLINILFIAIIALTSCKNQTEKSETAGNKPIQADPKGEFAKLNQFLRKFEEPSQTFKAPSDKQIKVVGKQGTIIRIDPIDLETEDGQPIGKEVDIELKELSSQQQLLRANAQTISDGQLLVSGGAYFIQATSDGKKLKLKSGRTYSVEFPKLTNDSMSLYFGQRDSIGKMNWKKAEQNFESAQLKQNSSKEYNAVIVLGSGRKADTSIVAMKNLTKEDKKQFEHELKMRDKVYNAMPLNQFGWVNCDKVFPNTPRTNLKFTITNNVEEVNYAAVYLVFKSVKSVWQSSYYVYDNKTEKEDFKNVPVGQYVKVFSVCNQRNKIFATLTDSILVNQNQTENLTLKEMNEADFDKLIKSIN